MSLDVAVLYRWPSGMCVVRPLTFNAHKRMAAQKWGDSDVVSRYWEKWHWELSDGILWSLIDETGVCSSTVLASYHGQKIIDTSIAGSPGSIEIDLPWWHRFLFDLLGEQGLAEAKSGTLARHLDLDAPVMSPGEFPVDFELYRLLGIDPMVWETDRFEPWWRELQAEGMAP